MGTYHPSRRKNRRSVSEMFSEAEDEHFLDCPNADFFIRFGSLLLDGILFFLCFSGVLHIDQMLNSLLPKLVVTADPPSEQMIFWRDTLAYLMTVVQLLLFYGYFLWPVIVFRGTPAKLLLGLRIVDAVNGGKPSIVQVLVRETLGKGLSLLLVGMGFLMSIFRSDHRALHDLISRTVVKRVHGGS